MMGTKELLVKKLLEITYYDNKGEYYKRNPKVYEAVVLAHQCSYDAGIRIDPENPAWPIALIELPTGQISYHLPQHLVEWDKGTSEEKKVSILDYTAIVTQEGG